MKIPAFSGGRPELPSLLAVAGLWLVPLVPAQDGTPLDGTNELDRAGDIASDLVAGVDTFLLREIARARESRAARWPREPEGREPRRSRLQEILGLAEPRPDPVELRLEATTERGSLAGQSEHVRIDEITWPAFGAVAAEGLLLRPNTAPRACAVVIPDVGQIPEDLAGLTDALPVDAQLALRLAENGCLAIVPAIVSRADQLENLTRREYLYRSAFELGRHLIGYEILQVQAALDWIERRHPGLPTGVAGWGEGGLLALYTAACDPRIDAALVSGYFDRRENLWQEPIDRNVFALLRDFGDAELATLIAPRRLIVETCRGPEAVIPGGRGAPARVVSPDAADAEAEVRRAADLTDPLPGAWLRHIVSGETGGGPAFSTETVAAFASALGLAPGDAPGGTITLARPFDRERAEAREGRLVAALDRHNQELLGSSADRRAEFMKGLDTSSPETFTETQMAYRRRFEEEVVGRFDLERLPAAPRSRQVYAEEGWLGYEVVLDVFPDVIAYGVLLLPRNIPPGERRPVVVCQHGLEGRPRDVIEGDHRAYHDFAARLAKRGFVVFAPQNLYIFGDRFRTLQRKANPLGKTLFSVIVPQHRQIVDWLRTLPSVDRERIAFYGLSYGGKTAMRVPPLLPDYCLSICSADFNEWVWKNASSSSPYSYVRTGEYEIFEWNLGGTFNYAEMAALIAPRPFMVERGHFDGVAPDEAVAYEFAKVRNLYAARLKLPDRCEIEWFDGPHTIHGRGTFDFLHRHLDWPAPAEGRR